MSVEREGKVLLSVVVSPMEMPNLYHTHRQAQFIPPKDTLAEKTNVRGQGTPCVCVCLRVHLRVCVWVQLIIHLRTSWKYCDCSTFASLFTLAI